MVKAYDKEEQRKKEEKQERQHEQGLFGVAWRADGRLPDVEHWQ